MEVLNYQNSSFVSNDCNRMANLGQVIPDICDVKVGKEDHTRKPCPQNVHSISIIINRKPETTIPFSAVNDKQNNKLHSNDLNQKEKGPSAPPESVRAGNVDNQQLPRSNEFKFTLANNVIAASPSTPLITTNLLPPPSIVSDHNPPTVQQPLCDSSVAPNLLPPPSIISDHNPPTVPVCSEINDNKKRPLEPSVGSAKKKFKGPQNVQKKIISPIRFHSKLRKEKRGRYTRNRIIPLQPLRFRNQSSPDYIISFILNYWPEMRISNPHNDLSKRFLFHGIFNYNSFDVGNDSININCTAPYEEVLKVLSAEKHAMRCQYVSSQYCWSDSQFNEAENKYEYLCRQEKKVFNAIKQVLQLYRSFQYIYCKFDACFINNSRFTQASSVFPIIKSYENFYGHA